MNIFELLTQSGIANDQLALIPDPATRAYHVRVLDTETDEIRREVVYAHTVEVTDSGALVFYTNVQQTTWTVACFAPGIWEGYSAVPPTGQEIHDYRRVSIEAAKAVMQSTPEAVEVKNPKTPRH